MRNRSNSRISRRQLLLGASSLAVVSSATIGVAWDATTRSTRSAFAALESRYGARLGVRAVDTRSGRCVQWRAHDRFAYCSTYKALAGGILLSSTSAGELERVVHFRSTDLVAYSPVTSQHVADGMTLGAIAEAAIRQSDNTAGNLLLRELGGPKDLQRLLRESGDRTTIVSRIEPDLNSAVPGDRRDTSTPSALAADVAALLAGRRLDAGDAARLEAWMSGNATGDSLIRAGAPAGWSVADKSGAGSYGTRNDIALVRRPSGPPIAMAILSTRTARDDPYDDRLIADAARVALTAFAT